ncbi:MAG: hypothetical protein KDK07_19605 [Bauldia sp.]|nr:hypothetical protein [Bauldia sp.]
MPASKDSHDRNAARFAGARAVWIVFVVIAAATLAVDLLIDHHGKFGVDGSIGFYAWYGLLVAIALTILSRLLGALLARPEDYYDR